MTRPADRSPASESLPVPSRPALPAARSGAGLVIGLLVLGVAAGTLAILFQRGQTRRCLSFYGPAVARRVASAPVVEVWRLQPGGAAGVLEAGERVDVSQAPGLVHLRRGLVEDANFRWPADDGPVGERLPSGAWDVALVFSDPARPGEDARVVIDLDDGPGGGAIAVVGRPGRIGLGRIAAGLSKWLAGVRPER